MKFDVLQEGETALMHGVEHYSIVHALVEKGNAQVNAKTSHVSILCRTNCNDYLNLHSICLYIRHKLYWDML